MAGKKGKTALAGGKEIPRRHHCPTHGLPCVMVKLMPGKRMAFNCPGPEGEPLHQINKGGTVLK